MTGLKSHPLVLVLVGAIVWFAALYGQSFGPGPAALYILGQAIGLIIFGIGAFRQIDAWDEAS